MVTFLKCFIPSVGTCMIYWGFLVFLFRNLRAFECSIKILAASLSLQRNLFAKFLKDSFRLPLGQKKTQYNLFCDANNKLRKNKNENNLFSSDNVCRLKIITLNGSMESRSNMKHYFSFSAFFFPFLVSFLIMAGFV